MGADTARNSAQDSLYGWLDGSKTLVSVGVSVVKPMRNQIRRGHTDESPHRPCRKDTVGENIPGGTAGRSGRKDGAMGKVRYYANARGDKVIAVEKTASGVVEATQIKSEKDEFMAADYATFDEADSALRWLRLDGFNKRFALERFYRTDAPIEIGGVFIRYAPKLRAYRADDCRQSGLPMYANKIEVPSGLKTRAERKKEKNPPGENELPVAWLRSVYGYSPLYKEEPNED